MPRTKNELAKVLLIAQAQIIEAAMNAMLDLDDQAGGVLPARTRANMEIALSELQSMERTLIPAKLEDNNEEE